jgi:hypothetical protein
MYPQIGFSVISWKINGRSLTQAFLLILSIRNYRKQYSFPISIRSLSSKGVFINIVSSKPIPYAIILTLIRLHEWSDSF